MVAVTLTVHASIRATCTASLCPVTSTVHASIVLVACMASLCPVTSTMHASIVVACMTSLCPITSALHAPIGAACTTILVAMQAAEGRGCMCHCFGNMRRGRRGNQKHCQHRQMYTSAVTSNPLQQDWLEWRQIPEICTLYCGNVPHIVHYDSKTQLQGHHIQIGVATHFPSLCEAPASSAWN
jgi:hypothetical protein